MVKVCVLDANVLVAASVTEALSLDAMRVLADLDEAHVPSICDLEVAHAFLRKVKKGIVPAQEAIRAFDLYLAIPIVNRHSIAHFNQGAFDIAIRNVLGANDLLYVLLAQKLGIPLITSDSGLLANAKEPCQCIELRTIA